MSSHSNNIENQTQDVVDMYKHDKNLNISQAAREFNVPY